MTRRRVKLAYSVIFLAAVSGTLALVNPTLLPPVLGFTALFLPLLFVFLLLDRLLAAWIFHRAHGWIAGTCGTVWAVVLFGVAGGPVAALLSVLLLWAAWTV